MAHTSGQKSHQPDVEVNEGKPVSEARHSRPRQDARLFDAPEESAERLQRKNIASAPLVSDRLFPAKHAPNRCRAKPRARFCFADPAGA